MIDSIDCVKLLLTMGEKITSEHISVTFEKAYINLW